MYKIVDFKTKACVNPLNYVFTGPQGPWEVEMDLEEISTRINFEYFKKCPPYVSKYLPLLPVKNFSSFVSLGEGASPLIRSNTLGADLNVDLFFKLEAQNPTGSFKDRGSAVELTLAKELAVPAIVLASTGNMAASCSCYAAKAGIPCYVFVPEGTPPSKLAQVISYGGRIVQVEGTYGDAARLAQAVAEELGFYLAGDYAFRVEGGKTAAFELLDQLFFRVPDYVVVPMGCGTNIASYAKGFAEYLKLGFIRRLPKLIGVQASGANPIVKSFEQGSAEIEECKVSTSVASAIAIGSPLDGVKALQAIYDTSGVAVDVSDSEMLECQYSLGAKEGLFVETSCAACLAGLKKIAEKTDLRDKTVVAVLTGSGLKDPGPILALAGKPPLIPASVDKFLELYRNS